MKTTTVRKLLPEAWGFICPVHTPDGAPCGLLNHISLSCLPLACEEIDMRKYGTSFKKVLTLLGMNPISSDFGMVYPQNYLPVLLDGKLLGYVDPHHSLQFVKSLRGLKIGATNKLIDSELAKSIPQTLEVAFLLSNEVTEMVSRQFGSGSSSSSTGSSDGSLKEKFYPGIFLASTPSRFVRPVKNLEYGGIEFIGPLEQVNLSIACLEEDLRADSSH